MNLLRGFQAGWQTRLTRIGSVPVAILAATLALCWPALWSGSAIWVPDSIVYIGNGHRLLAFLIGLPSAPTADALRDTRSVLYCSTEYLFHLDRSAWPVIGLSAFLVAWTIWLSVRSICCRHPLRLFVILVGLLCALTTVSWYVVMLTPDILGAVLYLSFYLLIFASESLARWEQFALGAILVWTVDVHATHLLIAPLCFLFLALLWLFRWQPIRGRGRPLLAVAGLILLAMLVQITVNARVFQKPSLFGAHVPFLLARLIEDGPARDYLQDSCPRTHWTICAFQDRFGWDENGFLWGPQSVWQTATPRERQALSAEEMPLLLATIKAHPIRQARRSLLNFYVELTTFEIANKTLRNSWMDGELDEAIPGARAAHLRSSDVLDTLPLRRLGKVQRIVAGVSCLLILPLCFGRRAGFRLRGLTAIVGFVLLANAAVTGMLSGQDARYEGRIIWLLTLVAGLAIANLLEGREPAFTLSPADASESLHSVA